MVDDAPPSALLSEEQLTEIECNYSVEEFLLSARLGRALLAHIRELEKRLAEAQGGLLEVANYLDRHFVGRTGRRMMWQEIIAHVSDIVNENDERNERMEQLQQRLNQTIADDCETDTRCRELLKQWDKSDSYGVEPLEVVIERALKALPREAVESFRSRLLEKVKAHLESLPYEPYAYAVQGQILDLVEHFPVER